MSRDSGRYPYLPLIDRPKITWPGGARVALSPSVTPWLIGYPQRIAVFARMLETIVESGSVWPETGIEVLDAFRGQQA
jgi:hypothetical protein